MIGRIAGVLALFLSICLWGSVSPAKATPSSDMVPGGSYLESCENVSYDPDTGTVWAGCWRGSGGILSAEGYPVVRAHDMSGCKAGTIWNDHGDLYCITQEPWGHGHVIPNGSYIATCTARRVENNVLIAECGKSGSGTRFTSLNLLGCDWTQDIGNHDGNLACVPGNTPAVAPRKFLPIELITPPGSPVKVKPVGVTPSVGELSRIPVEKAGSTEPQGSDESGASGPDDSDKDRDDKRKKRERKRKHRGERG